MAWFKTDDQLPDHRKSRHVRRSHPRKRRDVAPFGIWVLAGAWSSDGFVPLEILEDWDDDAEELADRLVRAKLWHRTTRDGEPGYVFHDWHDQNPAKDDNDPSKSGTFGNHVRWHVQRQTVMPDCDHCPKEPEPDRGDHRPDIAPISPPDVGSVGGESLPTRPDPTRTRPEPDRTTSSDKSDHAQVDRFDEFWEVYGNKVGRKKSEAAYRGALKKADVTEDMLIASAERYAEWCKQTDTFQKNPLTWLNGEHWADERPAREARRSRVGEHLALVQQLQAEEARVAHLPQIGDGR